MNPALLFVIIAFVLGGLIALIGRAANRDAHATSPARAGSPARSRIGDELALFYYEHGDDGKFDDIYRFCVIVVVDEPKLYAALSADDRFVVHESPPGKWLLMFRKEGDHNWDKNHVYTGMLAILKQHGVSAYLSTVVDND